VIIYFSSSSSSHVNKDVFASIYGLALDFFFSLSLGAALILRELRLFTEEDSCIIAASLLIVVVVSGLAIPSLGAAAR